MPSRRARASSSRADPLLPAEAEVESRFDVRAEMWAMFSMGWPMVVSFVCRIGMASTDTAFVGHLTNTTVGTFLERPYSAEVYLAAASLSDMIVSVLTVPPLAFNQVLNALVGQALGSGNKKMAGTWLQLSIFFLSTTMVPFLVIQYFFVGRVLRLLGFSPDVSDLAGIYARWNLFWPIPNGIYQCLRFYFQAQGISRPAMWNNLAFLLVNGLLNWIFVYGGPFAYLPPGGGQWHGFGFIGGAMSISTSRCLQPITYYIYMFVIRKAHRETWPGLSCDFLRCGRVRSFLWQALPLIGTLIFQCVSGQVTTLMIAQLGKLAIAASAAVAAALQIASSGLSAALTAVAAVRIGYHLGKGDANAARMSMWIVVSASVLSSVLLLAVLWPLRTQLCSLVTSDPETLPVAAALVAASFVGAGLGQLVNIGTSGVLSGQGRTFVTTLLSFGFELPTSIGGTALLVFVAKLRGPKGLLWITWAGSGFSLVEVVVVALIILCTNWRKCADAAKERQEASAAEGQEGGGTEGEQGESSTTSPLSRDSTVTSTPIALGIPVSDEQEESQRKRASIN
jgi:MATE family multidrug resistance protein